ncbi:MAG: D-alanyl-D-alanine carboxypeptidase/D-alanyl-D-alanine-endopeptidase [Myxococcota bacterium]|jgi:D-alanyl-D-alanine carboxypeptidase/D-alanyl-D-alanine-endopeptidase (penicillin-binding protein 4)|nr:D-alanyl-D-alanine carboxypeptidase/D-alanyl-D-alanine-endopeptidase [Myxococcota bacterium]
MRGGFGRARVFAIVFSLVLASCLSAKDAATEAFVPNSNDKGWLEQLDRVLTRDGLQGAYVAALVVRASDGQQLYAREPDRMMIPASNAKVLTALASLDAFGPTHRFETRILTSTPLDEAGMVENLIVVGGGDPALTNEDYWRMAAELREAGLTGVSGNIRVDDGLFDRVRWHPAVNGLSSRAYHAPVGALNANYGSFAVSVTPGARVGAQVSVTITPPVAYLPLVNEGTTLPRKRRRTLVVDRAKVPGAESVTVNGGVRLGDKRKAYYRSVLEPALYAGHVLKMQLAAVGIPVAGGVERGRVGSDAEPLHVFEGKPLLDVVRLFMKYSNNGIAEALVKNLGVQAGAGVGSWASGMPELRRRLLAHGVPAGSFSLVDGSGLSYENKVSPRALVAALRAGRSTFRFAPEFAAAFPIAARDGTLEERAEGARDRVRAKTGLLNNVTGLSGYATMMRTDGEPEEVVFSVIANATRHGDEAAMDALDRFAALVSDGPLGASSRVSRREEVSQPEE